MGLGVAAGEETRHSQEENHSTVAVFGELYGNSCDLLQKSSKGTMSLV